MKLEHWLAVLGLLALERVSRARGNGIFVKEGSPHEDLGWEAYDLFDECGINLGDYDEPLFVKVVDDEVVAALVGGDPYGLDESFAETVPEDELEAAEAWGSGIRRFSVCVAPDARRRGYARELIQDFLDWCSREGFTPEAWVVNEEAMNPLLEDLGFSPDGPIWQY